MKFDPNYLRATAIHPQISILKNDSYIAMNFEEGARVLDIGCGPGMDTVALANFVTKIGKVTGIDTDPDMVSAANSRAQEHGVERWVEHITAGATALPFPDNHFDACRCERVMQHLSVEDGLKVVKEAFRIVRPNGRVVFLDTDWASISVHSTNPIIERHLAVQSAFSWENGFAARGLPELLYKNGLMNIGFDVSNIRLDRAEIEQFVLSMMMKYDFSNTPISEADVMKWLQSLKKSEQDGRFFATVNMVLCYGEVKSGSQLSYVA